MSQSDKRLLWVVGAGGSPFEHALPRLTRRAEVYAFVVGRISQAKLDLLRQWCAEVRSVDLAECSGDITSAIEAYASTIGANGILTVSELAVLAVAETSRRLGLPGAGPNAILARDKWLMRRKWAEAGLPVPRFRRVDGLADLTAATHELTMPFLLKPCGRGGGIGQQVIAESTDLAAALSNVDGELRDAVRSGIVEYGGRADDLGHCVAEEIIDSTTESWYEDDRYGDYLSVEGIVAGGVYHPLAIMGRLPTLPSFAETAALTPCVLPEELQRRVEKLAADAVNTLGLETCATHTELKLMSDGRMCLLETAARPAGAMGTVIVEKVFGVDMVGLLAGELLGEPQIYPEQMLVKGNGAAAVVFVFGADSAGRPWSAEVPLHWRRLDWGKLVSEHSSVELVPSQLPPDGTPISPYHPGGGSLNYAGSVLLHSTTPETLLSDAYALMDGLEAALTAEAARQEGQPSG